MKIRWNRTGVRFRITPSELDALVRSEAIHEELMLPGGNWRAAILPGGDATRISLNEGCLRLLLAPADRDRLAAPETEGVYFTMETDDPARPLLRYYVEKDFPCAHPRPAEAAEPPSETFPAPCAQVTTKKEHGTHE